MNAAKDAVVGRPPYGTWDGLAAAPPLLSIEAFTAEAHVSKTTMGLFGDKSADEHIRRLEEAIGAPDCFFDDLLAEGDWSFVIKGHAFLEAFCVHLLVQKLDPRLEDVLAAMPLGGRTGKLAFVEALGLLDKPSVRFARAFTTLRNSVVHRVENLDFTFEAHIRSLGPTELSNFLREITAPFPDYASILNADSGLLAERHAKMVVHMCLLGAVTEGYFRLNPTEGNEVAEKAMLDAVLGALLITFEDIARSENES